MGKGITTLCIAAIRSSFHPKEVFQFGVSKKPIEISTHHEINDERKRFIRLSIPASEAFECTKSYSPCDPNLSFQFLSEIIQFGLSGAVPYE